MSETPEKRTPRANEHPVVQLVSAAGEVKACREWKKPIMVTLVTPPHGVVSKLHHDFFLTIDQAEELHELLGRIIECRD